MKSLTQSMLPTNAKNLAHVRSQLGSIVVDNTYQEMASGKVKSIAVVVAVDWNAVASSEPLRRSATAIRQA